MKAGIQKEPKLLIFHMFAMNMSEPGFNGLMDYQDYVEEGFILFPVNPFICVILFQTISVCIFSIFHGNYAFTLSGFLFTPVQARGRLWNDIFGKRPLLSFPRKRESIVLKPGCIRKSWGNMSFLRKQESISLWIAVSSTAMTGRTISFFAPLKP
ncbi:MAG: hypothetical protein HQL06_00810 [Nitrospirae bacterium]|nr:hypothetical protein [Nitrospirota bacterium]